ncbi:hypothetical protein CBS147317_5695 [Penicillium roqueforti]|nr:hypothetical protein CBS147372_2907 [Penicillium roqueforti]KAI3155824.1 hypothetical protein CBS147317_5695 [Penicillium roqueforti]
MKDESTCARIIRQLGTTYQGGENEDVSPAKELLDALKNIRVEPIYSDLIIVCRDDEYAVHKCILCPRSDFFAKACDSGFQEAFTNRVVLQEEPLLVEGMIEYLYHLDYGHRMFIEGLKSLSKAKANQELTRQINLETFTHAITEIYNSTPRNDRGLQDMAIKLTMDNLMLLGRMRQWSEQGSLPLKLPDGLMKTIPQFSYDLAVAMMDQKIADWECRGYGMNWENH